MNEGNDLFVFRRFLLDDDQQEVEQYHKAALEKLQTLFPGMTITNYDPLTLGIETDSYYSETGTDIYELGMVDGEIPAVRNRRDGNVITFRI